MSLQRRENDEQKIPFGALIEKIRDLEAAIKSLKENRDEESSSLETELKNTYEELFQKAQRKINDWKKGPIKKIRHVRINDLKL